ncbi:MAG: hypothetical protein A3G33_10385 [Omnitrophica bacterium RIFCSPLOWO2_12_FULL_44_17]|uniref:Putative manganese efflux pump MntP n=1 Tax=Candidatus Danuiimicrobium aquiferis TaxID=1801832 RepID=A0A1G1L127_9BACT|nr:MAG: hypothetical protein A3B72_01660 [Omnitrophica bacterium RIFCSPHIGHO2_02_FULL_45_28]OGW90461.1 MAG: hypothetical protein A3E74_03595 [Omnitrophica bacterium RIFCSPHIGHO2_12_FULL_44_12]OGW98846.1 MAG: hypothetical protein A3G33_10385 [Omnitrophica bacterium RIFCSPLOWO2_12_FULL_44_17]OGX02807.1 MAG: hypothetical protein A3J12_02505 [Omnitrophica bacterium RIFCSPLOWO2_02_FULL_44_11]
MNLVEIVILSFGLAMDAFAVSITSGFILKRPKIRHALKMGFSFGIFQSLMPILGWCAGTSLSAIIRNVDHWIAFALLFVIGGKMIYEGIKPGAENDNSNPLDFWMLMTLSVATSIDALAVGISFAFLKINIILPVIMIGSITFALSAFGVLIGRKFGHLFEDKIKIFGGVILIGIGIKILAEHLLN